MCAGDTMRLGVVAGAGGRAERVEDPAALAGGDGSTDLKAAPLLEYSPDQCGQEAVPSRPHHWDESVEIRPVGCNSVFCPDCGPRRGWGVRKRLQRVFAGQELVMVSGTIDPMFWPGHYVPDPSRPSGQRWLPTGSVVDGEYRPSQEQAYLYCSEKHVVGEWVKAMVKSGVLRRAVYFCARELQSGTGMIHFHLLVSVKYLPARGRCPVLRSIAVAIAMGPFPSGLGRSGRG